jgi:hypothetical protein
MLIRYSVATLRDRPLEEERGHEITCCERLYRPCWTQDERQSGRPFWEGLKEIAKDQRKTLSDLVGSIDTTREHSNLSSALRLFVLNHYNATAASHLADSRPSAIVAHASH